MTTSSYLPLLNVPIFPSDRYRRLPERIGAILRTANPVLLIQAEAIVALEAVATSLAHEGLVALNIVTSPYGLWFGEWLARAGAEVINLTAKGGQPITAKAVSAALKHDPRIRLLSMVHAESASGISNPLREIIALARSRDIVTVVDAVASVGGHPLTVDEMGIDVAVIGPQKALGGPAGVSALSVSPAARAMAEEAGGPRDSVLSLRDQLDWYDKGRGMLPGTPAPLEFFALEAALDRIEEESLEGLINRHVTAGIAARAGVSALGLLPFVDAQNASNLVTAAPVPTGLSPVDVIEASRPLGIELSAGVGNVANKIVRINHTGPRAVFETVLATVVGYGAALRKLGWHTDLGAATEAVTKAYLPPH
ncbi:pyridoxal-phosphate-dependent aminotransferase family protein [Oryzifoliimicrobium ureilyticus]|uniref:pyridoxal-phosphate-dependent aminotransferase family protein n=1 Tax=Oryzifoliimicrobium ureilyticus TaxID=3113724 RepID=UPI00307602AF